VVADLGTAIPGGSGPFEELIRPTLDSGSVAFIGLSYSSGVQEGVYTNAGGPLSVVADLTTAIPGGTGLFVGFPSRHHGGGIGTDGPVLAGGNVFFHGLGSAGQEGIYTNAGGPLAVIADLNTSVPGGSGNFIAFEGLAAADSHVAFLGLSLVSPGLGIYTNLSGSLEEVISFDDSLDGKAINGLVLLWEGLDQNEIAFLAYFDDGSEGIYVATISSSSSCHDGNWDDGEFCGRDAVLVTGVAEMNHDCTVDLMDLRLWLQEFALAGPGLSADLNGDGVVSLADLVTFLSTYGGTAAPCTPSGMLPEMCQGSIELSFDPDPTVIDPTQTQPAGTGRVYIVTDGWTDPAMIEYAVETSSNVVIVDHPETTFPHSQLTGIPITCDPDARHSWRGFVRSGGDWPAGPIVYNHLDYNVTDTNPAWIKLAPLAACFNNSKIYWGQADADRTHHFLTVGNAGINGPSPKGESTCHVPVPLLSPVLLWLLAVALVTVALTWRRLHQPARAHAVHP
jgi:hypothetical protein